MPPKAQLTRGATMISGARPKWLYGTFEAESPMGWMLELNRYLGDFQMLVWIYVILAIVLSLIWPVAWIVGIVIGVIASQGRPDLYSMTFQCFLATGLGIVMNTGPALVTFFAPGGVAGMVDRIENKELASVDMQAPWKAQMFLMLLYYFSVMYQGVNEQVVEIKKSIIPYLKNLGSSLNIVPEQRERLEARLKENGIEEQGDLVNLLNVLETLPAWGSPAEEDAKDEPTGFFALIKQARDKAHQKGLFALDIYTIHQLKYQVLSQQEDKDEAKDVMEGTPREEGHTEDWKRAVFKGLEDEGRASQERCIATFSYVIGYLLENKKTAAVVTVLSVLRVAIPRLWLKFYLGGLLFPHDKWALFFVIVATVTTTICYALFMAVFLVMVLEYYSNAQQLCLLTALIDMDARCQYAEQVLIKSEGMDPEEAEKCMACLPLLNLQKSRNAIGYWSLRNYVLVDRCNDRVGMQILISISMLLIIFNIVLVAYDLFTLPYIGPFVPIVLYDVLVMGLMIMFCLQQALVMNNWMAQHALHFNQAIHDIMSSHAEIMSGDEADAKKAQIADLTIARKFLKSSVTMIHENDPREALLFGAEVTPASIISSAAGFLATLGFMIYKILKSGKNPIDPGTVSLSAAVAGRGATKTTAFLVKRIMEIIL